MSGKAERNIRVRPWLVFPALLCLLPAAPAQTRHDPLNQLEIDQLRDTAQEPEKRLPLYVQFARERLVAVEKMRADPKVQDRGAQTHDGLDDFLSVYNELDDNVDNFADRRDDIRKPLKLIIEADTEFQSKLRAIKDAAGVSPQEASQYEFVLQDALGTVDDSIDDHRKLLAEQEEAAKNKKKRKAQP
ncbi:MAG TPA: hypothetical protein VMH85_19275 [Terriglobales bacterium]|nr:hypothetical protein [Terriglobales bacterium]